MSTNNMMGEFIWFVGVVESVDDPVQSGRVRVRCMGYHTEDRTKLPTDKLPWAITNGSLDIKEGSWVVGFFFDGTTAQNPCIMMKMSGIPTVVAEDVSTHIGFHDKGENMSSRPFPPTDISYTPGEAVSISEGSADYYPAKTESYQKQGIEEPDIPRAARSDEFGEKNTHIEKRKEIKDSTVTSAGGVTWDEPETQYAAKYPHNKVHQSESGHVIEIDDTPGAERLSVQHRSGTFIEIHPNGETVLKFLNNRYTMIAADDNVIIHGVSNVTVVKDKNVVVSENETTEIGKNSSINIGVNETRNIGGDKTENVSGNSVFTGSMIRLN